MKDLTTMEMDGLKLMTYITVIYHKEDESSLPNPRETMNSGCYVQTIILSLTNCSGMIWEKRSKIHVSLKQIRLGQRSQVAAADPRNRASQVGNTKVKDPTTRPTGLNLF